MKPIVDDATAPFYTIGQIAAILGVSPATLRRLEREDLVLPGRSPGGQRRYSRNDVERLHDILALIEEGLTPAGAGKVLALRQQVIALESELAELRTRAG